jgi:hypothetical protein
MCMLLPSPFHHTNVASVTKCFKRACSHPFLCCSTHRKGLSNNVFAEHLDKKQWESTTGVKLAKKLISGPSASRTKDLFKLNRDQLRWIVGLFTGHCHLKGHLFKLWLTDDPSCERYLEDDESATHVLCDCEPTAHLRFRHLGQFFVEPSDFYDAPISKVLHSIRSVGLIKD